MGRSFAVQLLSLCFALFFAISVCAPTTQTELGLLSKRDSALYSLWNSIPKTRIAQGISGLAFSVDRGTPGSWGITYLYGCTGIMISDPSFVQVAHLQQDSPLEEKCLSLDDSRAVRNYIDKQLTRMTDLFAFGQNTRIDIIVQAGMQNSKGLRAIVDFLQDPDDLNYENGISYWPYPASAGIGSPNPDAPQGLAVVQWVPGNAVPHGTLNVFWNQENPIRSTTF